MEETSRIYYTNSIPLEFTAWDKTIIEKSEEFKMNKFVSDNYKNTDDALLVQKWFGGDLPCDSSFLNKLVFKGKMSDILAEAKRLEKESKQRSLK